SLNTLFFQSSLLHQDLHSFPTRRSSDLNQRIHPNKRSAPFRKGRTTSDSARFFPLLPNPKRRLSGYPICPRFMRRSISRFSALRSEEHTSELQSRFDLVCRLLLEKKKL